MDVLLHIYMQTQSYKGKKDSKTVQKNYSLSKNLPSADIWTYSHTSVQKTHTQIDKQTHTNNETHTHIAIHTHKNSER